jgi:hypothetical protein
MVQELDGRPSNQASEIDVREFTCEVCKPFGRFGVRQRNPVSTVLLLSGNQSELGKVRDHARRVTRIPLKRIS